VNETFRYSIIENSEQLFFKWFNANRLLEQRGLW
jgi:hypothetical protein